MQQFYGKGCGFIGSNAPSVKGSGRVSESVKRQLKPIHKFAKDVVDLSKKAYLMRRFIAGDGTKVGYPSWPKESDCKSAGRSPSGVRIPLPPPLFNRDLRSGQSGARSVRCRSGAAGGSWCFRMLRFRASWQSTPVDARSRRER